MTRAPLLIAALALLPLLVCRAEEDRFVLSTNELPCRIEVKNEHFPPAPVTRRVYVHAGTNAYAFAIPAGYRVESSTKGRLTLTTEDYTRFISFSILLPVEADTGSTAREPYREFVLKHKENSELLAANQAVADALPGHAFDVLWSGSADLPRICRTVFVPSTEGALQFRADALRDQFLNLQVDLNFVLATFVAQKDGRLEVAPLTGNY